MLKAVLVQFPTKNVCFGGGVALNCTANAHLIRSLGINLHIHPAAGDAGGALGAALNRAVRGSNTQPWRAAFQPYLGVEYSDAAIENSLALNNVPYRKVPDIAAFTAAALAQGQIVAVAQGRDEWGPRALGNRSILADPRRAAMKDHLNAKIKFREEFRPFAPVVMHEHYDAFFETLGTSESPYMLYTHKALQPEAVPAVVHADQTSRVQTVSRHQNPFLYAVLEEFYRLTGVPVLINTSFNLRGEPIVSSPADALKTFYASGIDVLVLHDYVVEKQPAGASVPETLSTTRICSCL
jgi:carbamoyltransferase